MSIYYNLTTDDSAFLYSSGYSGVLLCLCNTFCHVLPISGLDVTDASLAVQLMIEAYHTYTFIFALYF